MPSPSAALSTLRPDIASALQDFDLVANQTGMIARKVLAPISVAKPSGTYYEIPANQLLVERQTLRASGAGYSRGKYTFTSGTFSCLEYGAEEALDDGDRAKYSDGFRAEVIAAQRAQHAVLLQEEIAAATLLFNASTWTGASLFLSVTNEWDDLSNAVPISDVGAAVAAIRAGSGQNTGLYGIMDQSVFNNLRRCEQVIDVIASAGAGSSQIQKRISEALVAEVLGLDGLIVGRAMKNTAQEGQSVSFAQVWNPEYCMIAKVAQSEDFKDPCVGRTFHWDDDGANLEAAIEQYRDEPIRSDIFRARHWRDQKTVMVASAFLLGNVTTI